MHALNRTLIDFNYAEFGMFVKEMLFLLGYKLCLLKIAIRREKFDKKVSENGVKVAHLRDRNSLDDRPDFE